VTEQIRGGVKEIIKDDSRPNQRLKASTISPWGLAALAIGITSPAMGLYGLWGPMQVAAGPITPLIFLAAMVMILPTALSYAALNSYAPSAGAASSWLWISVSPAVGFLAGLAMTTYFVMATVAQPLIFAVFFSGFLHWFNLTIPSMEALLIGVLVATAPVAWLALRGAEASVRVTVQLMAIETLVVIALSATVLIFKLHMPGTINFLPLDPHQATHGFSGFWAAMILGTLAYCGFDVVSTAAEEARAPREHIPKAILITIIGITLFWAMNAWVFTISTPPEKVEAYTTNGLTAVIPLAETYWGSGSLIVIITAFTAITAVYISCVQGASRLAFALARHRLLPSWLGQLSGEARIPRNAVLAVLVTTVVLDAVTIFLLKSGLDSFVWWANALVFFATLTFLGVNVANICYFRRLPGYRFGILKNLLVPTAGIVLNAYLIYAAFFKSLWSTDMRTGKSVVIASVAVLLAQLVAVSVIRFFRSASLAHGAPIGVDV
jgi:amino acid transporter